MLFRSHQAFFSFSFFSPWPAQSIPPLHGRAPTVSTDPVPCRWLSWSLRAGRARQRLFKNNYSNYPLDAPVFEIRPGDIGGVRIKVNIIDEGSITPLSFGRTDHKDTIYIKPEDQLATECRV